MESTDTVKAVRILQDAEQKLLYLVGNSAHLGDYEAIATITSWAQTVRGLVREVASSNGVSEVRADVSHSRPATGPGIGSSRKQGPKAYPVFYRDGSVLVKVGWSKTQKAEYEHKAPESVLDDVLKALTKNVKSGSKFSMEALLPIYSASDGSELPSYQSYLCIAWLRKEGLVMQHGRQGYSMKPGVDIVRCAKDAFQSLPVRAENE